MPMTWEEDFGNVAIELNKKLRMFAEFPIAFLDMCPQSLSDYEHNEAWIRSVQQSASKLTKDSDAGEPFSLDCTGDEVVLWKAARMVIDEPENCVSDKIEMQLMTEVYEAKLDDDFPTDDLWTNLCLCEHYDDPEDLDLQHPSNWWVQF